ncbi:hypothetical protein BGZ58_010574 [Dissophora ornata]|nr:hypothetical protein BGZ58_010574 [Dissophora ornata]
MTKDDTHIQIAGLGRLQLQSLCVKAGLDSTADNGELRKILQEHYNQHGGLSSERGATNAASAENAAELETVVKTEDITQDIHGTTDTATEIKVEVKQEDNHGATDVSMEDTVASEVKEAVVVATSAEDTRIKEEAKDESLTLPGPENTATVKSEPDDYSTVLPIAQRKKFWESKTTSARSTVRAAQSSSQQTTPSSATRSGVDTVRLAVIISSSSTARPVQKRVRTIDDTGIDVNDDADINVKEEEGGDDIESSLPTPGTVRNLIGRFAGSAISPPGTPAIKKRKMDAVKTSPAPAATPTIPRHKKIIKIPVTATVANNKSSPAPGRSNASRAGSASSTTTTRPVAGVKRKAVSESAPSHSTSQSSSSAPGPSSSSTAAVAKKPVSAETINRLATPKKIRAASSVTSNATPMAPPSSTATSLSSSSSALTTTRPRGPVLSTASRAAQRRTRERK